MDITPSEFFHQHLDECEHCREHLWDLCARGYQLLKEVAESPGAITLASAAERALRGEE
jgi:predicted anti-sigma-YlaC factor YlaD